MQFFLKGVAVSFTSMLLLGIINYLIRRHLALHLSTEDFGFFYSMFAFFGLLTTFCQFGIKQSSAILTASYIAKRQESRINLLLSSLLTFTVCFCAVIMLILMSGCRFLASAYFKYSEAAAAIMVFAPFILLNPVWSLFLSIPHGKLEFPVYNGFFIFQMLLIYTGVLIFSKFGILALSSSWISAMIIAMAVAVFFICRRYRLNLSFHKAFCPAINRKIWNLCSWMAISTTGLMMLSFLDSFFLTWLTDLKQVAAYNIALPIMQILQSLTVLPLVFLPFSADLWEKKKYRELARIFHSVNLIILIGTLPLVILLHHLGPWIITVLFGKRFISSAPALTLLSAGVLFCVAGQFNLNLLNASGKQKTGAGIILAVLFADAALNFLLVPVYGFKGSAMALSCSYILTAILTYAFAARELMSRKVPPSRTACKNEEKLIILNCFSSLKIEISNDLPSPVRNELTKKWHRLSEGEPEPEFTLQIRGKYSRNFSPDSLRFEADGNELSSDLYEIRGNYKFSSWRYRVFWINAKTLRLEFNSDFFARWVYPMRIIPQFIQYMLYYSGFCFFHASGFYSEQNGSNAVIMAAASGTGKTLTTLHWLSDGGMIYDDDMVAWRDGEIYPTPNLHINFWSMRYKKNPKVLPPKMLVLKGRDIWKERFFALISFLTHGYVTFGCNIDIESYFPGAKAPTAKLTKLLIVSKGEKFDLEKQISQDDRVRLENRITGDFEFQHLALLRLDELEAFTGFHLLDIQKMFAFYRQSLHSVVQTIPVTKIKVPRQYSREIYLSIAEQIKGQTK